MAKKKGNNGINMLKRLMNILTIVVAVASMYALDGLNSLKAREEAIIYILIYWGSLLALNYVFFKKLTIWHKD